MELNLNSGNILISGKVGFGKEKLVKHLLMKVHDKKCIFYLDGHEDGGVEFLFRDNQSTTAYDEESSEDTIKEVLGVLVDQFLYRDSLIKECNVNSIDECVGTLVKKFRFQDTEYMADDIVKVETDDGYKYVLADNLCAYVKNVEFFKGEYYPTQTILAMAECFTTDKVLNDRLELIAHGGRVKQSLIQTCQCVEQVPTELLPSFPTRLEMVGRNKGVIYHNGVFSNYEI